MQKYLVRIPIVFWIGLVTVALIVVGLVFVSQIQKASPENPAAARPAKLLPGVVEFESQGAAHIPPGTSHPPYNSNPPTSGWHHPSPAAWGIYQNQLADETLVHNLEHGGIWISYQPDLAADQKDKLTEIVKGYRSKVILAPRVQNDSAIALVAWQRLLKLETVDEAKISEFISTYRNKGPERVPD